MVFLKKKEEGCMNNNNNIENKVVYLRLDDILPNRFQPRENFDQKDLEELSDSIKEHGIIQPVIVRQVGDKYELIAGERRTKASALAGLTTIPAIVRNMDDKESAKISLLENLQRKNLSAIEEARTYKRIKELDNMTQEDLAKTLGKSQPAIANKLRLLSLPEEVQDALIKNQISERHARSLLNVKDKKTQLMLLDRIRNERLTVRELDNEIKKINDNDQESSSATGNSYNNFEEQDSKEDFNSMPTNNNSFANPVNNNYRGNFNNMGLNDYQSGINNNMFNNIPTNFQNTNNSFNNMPSSGFMNQNNDAVDVDYSEFNTNEENYMQNNLNQANTPDSFSSLGSMFDNSSNTSPVNNYQEDNNSSNQNLFISHIQEDEVKKKENQFLPNFDSLPMDNNGNYNAENFSNNNESFRFQNSPNSFNQENFQISANPSNQENFNNFQNPSYPNDLNSSFDNFNNYQKPIDDFDNFNNNYPANQGSLFNQPLNIVDVPKNNNIMETNGDNTSSYEDDNVNLNKEDNSYEENSNFSQEDVENENDSHLPYENILFAKPVPINPEEQEGSSTNSEDVEVIDEESNSQEPEENKDKSKNEYINIDHVRTIFTTRDAVLELKKTTDRIKQDGINIDTEEIDFDDIYQIIIKIKKEEK